MSGGRAAIVPAAVGGGEDVADAVPQPETGTVMLPDRSLVLPPAAAPFDAPRRFTLVPLQPVKERTPDIERHAALFETAIETAARFAADLLGDAARDADEARSADRRRAAARQGNLDARPDHPRQSRWTPRALRSHSPSVRRRP